LLLPFIVLGLLFAFQKEFVVKSDIQGFRSAVRFTIIVLVVALIYGVAGFLLLDKSDFHQEISLPTAMHYTVDQFDLTTERPLQPYTRRARLFTDSLSFVSFAALVYVAISLFQPLRASLSAQTSEREHVRHLLRRYGGSSEEFFKLWPHDKQYFFDDSGECVLAFRAHRGVALCLGDPIGDSGQFPALMRSFKQLCFNNDWLPAFIHVADTHRQLYERHGFILQKLGEEAVLALGHFQKELRDAKYFRQIRNKFVKQGFSSELIMPPHHSAVLERLKVVSDEWLATGGRAERGFAMGYYTTEYIQQCPVMVVRDAAGTIQAFANVVPADFDREEATYDMLRRSKKSLGNINDFLLMELIDVLIGQGYVRLNLGLSPLVGLDDIEKDRRNLIDNLLHFAYANGDRFYSFSGLHRFKGKYEPEWDDRYLAYQEGVRNFSKTMTGLMRVLNVKVRR
ncbi:MAG TPA: phosphatidylglycerol lysyltransferase domain-containing protein, partial [Verrucomicrobiae bacterium]|nr:phosphatidylglycerol lysyltransferase domain-containing protein [Verrucomicrobiae bacterium]